MPAVTGLVYLVPTIIVIVLASAIPVPSKDEQEIHSQRRPMTRQDQKNFIKKFWPGLTLLILLELSVFVLMTIRDLFQSEIWSELFPEQRVDSSVYLATELPVTILTILSMCLLSFIKSSRTSVILQHGVFVWCGCVMFASQVLFDAEIIGPVTWFIAIGYCTMMTYSPITSMLVDRLFGAMQVTGTVTFTMNLSAMVTNFGTIALLLFKGVQDRKQTEQGNTLNSVNFFSWTVYVVSIMVIVLSCGSLLCWWTRLKSGKSFWDDIEQDAKKEKTKKALPPLPKGKRLTVDDENMAIDI